MSLRNDPDTLFCVPIRKCQLREHIVFLSEFFCRRAVIDDVRCRSARQFTKKKTNKRSSSWSLSVPFGVSGFTIVMFFSFGRRTSPIQLLFLLALFHSMGQSMTIFLNTPLYSFSSKSRTNTLFPQFVWPHIMAECGYFRN